MTIEEFKNTKFSGCTKVMYQGEIKEVTMINLEESLFGLKEEEGTYWVRCENCKLISL